MKKIAFVSIPVLLLLLLFLVFANNRVLIPASPALPRLSALGGLQPSASLGGAVKSASFERTTGGKTYKVKLVILPLSWGQIIPSSSTSVKTNVENNIKFINKLLPLKSDRLSEAREFPFNGKPGCAYVLTRSDTGEAYAKVLDFVQSAALYRLSSNVKGNKLSAQDKAEAAKLFEQYLVQLQKEVK